MKIAATLPALLLASVLAAPAFAAAGSNEGAGGDHRPPGPPLEAFAACKGKRAGATVSLTTPDGRAVTGTCQLTFQPDGHPGEGGKEGGRQGKKKDSDN